MIISYVACWNSVNLGLWILVALLAPAVSGGLFPPLTLCSSLFFLLSQCHCFLLMFEGRHNSAPYSSLSKSFPLSCPDYGSHHLPSLSPGFLSQFICCQNSSWNDHLLISLCCLKLGWLSLAPEGNANSQCPRHYDQHFMALVPGAPVSICVLYNLATLYYWQFPELRVSSQEKKNQ